MKKCSDEGGQCECDSYILYGEEKNGKINKDSNFTRKAADASGVTDCTNGIFGDPLPGVGKACFCKSGATIVENETPRMKKCSDEGGNCKCDS
jgi:hypothetical protein